jgi:hypothetical protein
VKGRSGLRRSFWLPLLTLLATSFPILLSAQQPEPPAVLSQPAVDSALVPQPAGRVGPGGAFLRAIAVPGWGHASIEEHTRGGFYFLVESTAAWMVVRTRLRLRAAKDVEASRLRDVRARLLAAGVSDPATIATAQDNDEGVVAARSLVEARSQQFEDWLVFGIFFVFLSGADAFVSAHLKDFPQPLGIAVRADGGALQLGVSLPIGGAGTR